MTINVDDFDEAPDPWELPSDDRPRHPVNRAQLAPRRPQAEPPSAIVAASSPAAAAPLSGRPGARRAIAAVSMLGKARKAPMASPGKTAEPTGGQAAPSLPVPGAAARAKAGPPRPSSPAKARPAERPAERKKPRP
jgi:hypothetical protein